MQRRSAMVWIAAGAGFAAAGGLLTACSKQAPAFVAFDITGVDYGRDFSLTDHNGKTRHLGDFAGKVVVLFFGYTQCPDFCPTSMLELAEAKKALGQDGERLQGLFITVDPERDTPELLKAYMGNFDPSFLALYTSPEKLAALAREFKVYYKKVPSEPATTPPSYTMDHSAGSYIYDTRGRLRLFTRYGSGAPALASDIAILLKEAP